MKAREWKERTNLLSVYYSSNAPFLLTLTLFLESIQEVVLNCILQQGLSLQIRPLSRERFSCSYPFQSFFRLSVQ